MNVHEQVLVNRLSMVRPENKSGLTPSSLVRSETGWLKLVHTALMTYPIEQEARTGYTTSSQSDWQEFETLVHSL